jgi:hypothetical protein
LVPGDTQKGGKKSLLGAIGLHWSTYEGDFDQVKRAAGYLALTIGREGGPYDYIHVQGFNDTHTHAEVLAVLDRAIGLAELQPNRHFEDRETDPMGAAARRLLEGAVALPASKWPQSTCPGIVKYEPLTTRRVHGPHGPEGATAATLDPPTFGDRARFGRPGIAMQCLASIIAAHVVKAHRSIGGAQEEAAEVPVPFEAHDTPSGAAGLPGESFLNAFIQHCRGLYPSRVGAKTPNHVKEPGLTQKSPPRLLTAADEVTP